MAVLNEDENLNPNGQPGQPGASTGGAGFVSGGAGGQGATTSPGGGSPKPTSSGSYTNLMSYIGANKGNGEQMGQAASGVVNTAGQAADKGIEDFKKAGIADAVHGTAGVNNATVNSLQHAGDTGEYKAPQMTSDVSYTGPKGADDTSGYSAAFPGLNKLVGPDGKSGLVGLTGAGGGRDAQTNVGSLLGQTYQQPSYNYGENQLDSFLTGASPGGQAALKGIKDQWGGEGAKFDAASTDVNNAIQQGQKTSAATSAAYADATKQGHDTAIKVAADKKAQADKISNAAAAAAAIGSKQNTAGSLGAEKKPIPDGGEAYQPPGSNGPTRSPELNAVLSAPGQFDQITKAISPSPVGQGALGDPAPLAKVAAKRMPKFKR